MPIAFAGASQNLRIHIYSRHAGADRASNFAIRTAPAISVRAEPASAKRRASAERASVDAEASLVEHAEDYKGRMMFEPSDWKEPPPEIVRSARALLATDRDAGGDDEDVETRDDDEWWGCRDECTVKNHSFSVDPKTVAFFMLVDRNADRNDKNIKFIFWQLRSSTMHSGVIDSDAKVVPYITSDNRKIDARAGSLRTRTTAQISDRKIFHPWGTYRTKLPPECCIWRG